MFRTFLKMFIYLVKYVFQIKHHVSCEFNCNLMKRNVTQVNGGIMINLDVSVKTSCMWKILCLESCCV